jgi:hypothetical protein
MAASHALAARAGALALLVVLLVRAAFALDGQSLIWPPGYQSQ